MCKDKINVIVDDILTTCKETNANPLSYLRDCCGKEIQEEFGFNLYKIVEKRLIEKLNESEE